MVSDYIFPISNKLTAFFESIVNDNQVVQLHFYQYLMLNYDKQKRNHLLYILMLKIEKDSDYMSFLLTLIIMLERILNHLILHALNVILMI